MSNWEIFQIDQFEQIGNSFLASALKRYSFLSPVVYLVFNNFKNILN